MDPENYIYPQSAIDSAIKIINFNSDGLVPAIAQQHDTGEVLMMAWMNRESITETLKNGLVCYYSRSRKKLWRKGEVSGHTQSLKDFRIDCDGDTILLLVQQIGVACHTGRPNCFFNSVVTDGIKVITDVKIDPKDMYNK
jgi:phosphoribosyl-AMP cyclohydrolase|tara:strand:+ start:477 stop:896 length:420 start_codon:yes stop_codon:yes gene_type:complete